MFVDVKKYVKLLCKYKLTPEQFLLCYLLHQNDMASLYQYAEELDCVTPEALDDLVARGYLVDTNKVIDGRPDYYPEKYVCTSTFKDLIFIDGGEAFDELFELYPDFMWIDGKKAPLKGVDSIEALEQVYGRMIKWSSLKHEEVKELLQYGIKNNMINMGIAKWIGSKGWEQIKREKKANEQVNGYGLTKA